MTLKKSYRVLASNLTDEYVVQLAVFEGKLSAHCSCPAGELGKNCKHKRGLLLGTVDTLPVEQAATAKSEIKLMVEGSQVPVMLKELENAEIAALAAEKRLERAKKALEKSTRENSD